jgi:SAM-dependent methyltransferase
MFRRRARNRRKKRDGEIQWDSQLYLRYERERTQPSIDLASRIDLDSPATIIDLGCGPGNSTRVLRERWPAAHIIGLDSSTAMIEKARQTSDATDWRIGLGDGLFSRTGKSRSHCRLLLQHWAQTVSGGIAIGGTERTNLRLLS